MKTEMVDRSQQTCSVVDLRLIMRWARYLMAGDIPYFHITHSSFFHFSILFLASQIDIFFI